MKSFSYKAINNQTGKVMRGSLSANSIDELEKNLKNLDLEIISYKEKSKSFSAFTGKIKGKDLITIFVHFDQLEKAGIPILESISDLRDDTDSEKIRNLMNSIYEHVENGLMLSQALEKFPKVFDEIFVGLVRVGESTGSLSESFNSIVEHLKWSMEMKRKIVKAVRYPAFTILLMFGIIMMMMSFVVPKVTGFLSAQDIALPIYTKALIATSGFMTNNWFLVLLIPISIYVGIKFIYKSNFLGLPIKLDELKLNIPIFGQTLMKIEAARFCHFFAMTFKSGIDTIECIETAGNAANNLRVKAAIDLLKQNVSDGNSLTKSVQYTGIFPSLVVRMFKVGEESGNMVESLQNVRFFYDQEINDSVEKMIGMVNPALTLISGLLIGWIAMAVLGPIYSSFKNLG